MCDFDEVALRVHYVRDGFISRRRLVDDVCILTALDTQGCRFVIGDGEPASCFGSRHRTARAVAAAIEAFRIAEPASDKALRTHTARDYSHITRTSTNRSLAGNVDILSIVMLDRHVVMVAVDHFERCLKWRNPI